MISRSSPSNKQTPLLAVLMALLNGITRVCLLLSGLALLILLLSYIYEVVMRYFFNAPTLWTYDMSTWFLCIMIMLALPAVTRDGGNIAITFLLEKMSKAAQHSFNKVIALISCGICLVTAWICFSETIRQFEQGIETLWNSPVPKWVISIVIPFGFLISGCHFLTFCFNSPQESLE
ncbi:MAG: TRAP transporter small permease [bacterium]